MVQKVPLSYSPQYPPALARKFLWALIPEKPATISLVALVITVLTLIVSLRNLPDTNYTLVTTPVSIVIEIFLKKSL
tara:strand:+ start:23 stop:253 length:231 start_codon:yes stop_codon:yes gene_type:complete